MNIITEIAIAIARVIVRAATVAAWILVPPISGCIRAVFGQPKE